MGSRETSIVSYDKGRSPSARRSPSTHRHRSDNRSRSRSKSKSKSAAYNFRTEKSRLFHERLTQKKFAREQAGARVEAAVKAVDAAQKSLEAAVAAESELAKELQEMQNEGVKIDLEERIQRIVDERQDARRARDYRKSDELRQELRSMGVEVNDNEFIWTGPQGLTGKNFYGGAPPPKRGGGGGGGGGGGKDDRGGRDKGRRSPSYDDKKKKGGRGGRKKDRKKRHKGSYSYSDSYSD